MTEVIMPKMGDGMEEGTLLEWLKKEGDAVKTGDVIGTIQTDKATLELESPGSGVLSGVLLKEGGTVPVGVPIAAILSSGEKLPGGWGGGSEKQASPAKPAAQPPSAPTAEPAPPAQASSETNGAPPPASGRVKASPLAKKIAGEKGIDLSTIKGSGPGGRIVEKDLVSAPAAAPTAAVAAPAASALDREQPLGRLRQITAKRTAESKQQVPHFYVTVEVDVEQIAHFRQIFAEEESGKVSINDFVVRACALALREMPEVNATFKGQSVTLHGAVNIGMAVAVPDGLTVAVIKSADALTLRQIAAKSKDLAGKAKDNKLSMDELSDSTFSISNMGMLDVDEFIAIVNQPNAGILAIASARKRAVVDEQGNIVARTRMNITGSFDHRVVDGAIGARFMNVVRSYLEAPSKLLS